MRSVRTIQGLIALAMPLLGAVVLLAQAGCANDENKARFYTYCDNTGCYQCDETGCGLSPGRPPGVACASSNDCAPGCFCDGSKKCAEAGFCDRPGDCSRGFVCNVARHSCEPESGSQGTMPKSCRVQTDCGIGNECYNASCRAVPLPTQPCVFNRECGSGGQCVDGLCQRACSDDTSCGTGRACVNKRCVAKPAGTNGCVTNSQCGAGQTCIDSSCHSGCTKDSECQAVNKNDLCVASVCRPDERRVPECKINADCSGGAECVNAQCRTFCYANSDCALCTDTTACQDGYCMTAAEISPQCRLPKDCNAGAQHCVNAACASVQ